MVREEVIDYLRMAYQAARHSPDPSNQNGAVLVTQDKQVAFACNQFTPGFEPTPAILADRDVKLLYMEHAERGAIYGAAMKGLVTAGASLICPWAACADCARAIAASGITDVYTHQERMAKTPERWRMSVAIGEVILVAAKVKLHYVQVNLGCDPVLVNGEAWKP